MQTGIKCISLEGSAGFLVIFGAGLVRRAVGLGRLMLASVAGADTDFSCSECSWSVNSICATAACALFNSGVFLTTPAAPKEGGSWTVSCGGKRGPALVTAQGPCCTLDPQGSVLICFCCIRSISLKQGDDD